jgi:hypothetical protein
LRASGVIDRSQFGLNADSELREFVPEDALPNEVLSDLLPEWSLPAMTTLWAVLGDEDAEAVREENHWRVVVWPETDGQNTKKKRRAIRPNAPEWEPGRRDTLETLLSDFAPPFPALGRRDVGALPRVREQDN